MFSFLNPIKGYLIAGLAVLFAGLVAAIKILTLQNAAKKREIETLENNAEVKEKAHTDDLKRTKFDAVQKERVENLPTTSKLDELAKKRGEVKDEDGYTTINK